ncbi:NADPH-dependent FMN reductase [Pseudoxanthomonas sp.]|uniref:NADPH-dependent FMN reductase n=1 Tax=Pseudoxanthomonas sp. TaxID=1871049 RepID=UPI00260701CB|nr:NADPH-dependent FMN reductase [Pseudoxanthomonas sp.]WDS36262.1 MAG: NAD(P)H-dependent oxidoreductase [Pseudoxanthomonas sp.]
MKLLAISGSPRRQSTNTALLLAMQEIAPAGFDIRVFDRVDALPVFSPDAEGSMTPPAILEIAAQITWSDAVVISSPEYVRAIPGGLKNLIDWLVSRQEIVHKPIALAHASHRGDDMLASLRRVLSTVSSCFLEHPFLRIPLLGQAPEEIRRLLTEAAYADQVRMFLLQIAAARGAGTQAPSPTAGKVLHAP